MINIIRLVTFAAFLFALVNVTADTGVGNIAGSKKESAIPTNQFDYIDDVAAKDLLQVTDRKLSVRVSAQVNKWQSTGVLIKPGYTYKVTATGQWKLAPVCNPTGPDGEGIYNALCWNIGGQTVKGYTHSALIGTIGHGNKPFFVGKEYEFISDEEGVLYFLSNDLPGFFHDNTGFLSVTVSLKSTNNIEEKSAVAPVNEQERSTEDTVSGDIPAMEGGGGGGGRPPPE